MYDHHEPTQPENFPKPGEVIADRYRIEEVIGRGAMGVVVAAVHLHLGQRVAIKFIKGAAHQQTEQIVARFAREARAIAALESEYVVRVLDFGILESGVPYMVMQHLVGEDLMGAIRARGGSLPASETVDYVLQACAGLADAHAVGIVHRDVKPGNMFLMRKPSGEVTLKILDFGISKAPKESDQELSLTDTQATLGSPLYMSPEQIRQAKSVDQRTDIWSLGIVIFHMLTGKIPFHGQGASGFLAAVVADEPLPLRSVAPELPRELEVIISRCLQKNPAFRYANVVELATALGPFASPRGQLVLQRLIAAQSPAPEVTGPRVTGRSSPMASTAGADFGTAAPSVVSAGSEGSTRRSGLARLAWSGAAVAILALGGAAWLFASTRSSGRDETRTPAASPASATTASVAAAPAPSPATLASSSPLPSPSASPAPSLAQAPSAMSAAPTDSVRRVPAATTTVPRARPAQPRPTTTPATNPLDTHD